MKTFTFTAAAFAILLNAGCGPSAEEKAKAESLANQQTEEMKSANFKSSGAPSSGEQSFGVADAVDKNITDNSKGAPFMSSSAAVVDSKDTVHKFIRTADLRFKVVSVINSTYDIEHIAKLQEGFVTNTNLLSHIDYTDNTVVSPDSILETTYFTVNNEITLRVPCTKLDTTLKLISKNIDFLDYRNIHAEDVALDLYANSLKQKRSEKNGQRVSKAIDERGKKLGETTDAEDLVYNRQEQADEAKVSNMRIQDQINYSTITIHIYQRQTIKRELVANVKNTEAYEPGFGYRLVEAFKTGWEILKSITLVVIKLWWLFLIAFVVYASYKRFINRK
jgi:hypothetical protein